MSGDEADDHEALLVLDDAGFEMAPGVVAEFAVRRTEKTPQRPHGISYTLVLRSKTGGAPWLRFDNAHAIREKGRGYKTRRVQYDHWHRTAKDHGRPYNFTTASQFAQ